MKQTFEYGLYSYEYYIEFTERKTLGLEVLPDLRIIVKVPLDTTLTEIEAFLTRKWHWLEKQLSELRKLKKTTSEKQYVTGESFHYLGRQYMLYVEESDADQVKLERGKLHLYTTKSLRNGTHNQWLIEQWYAYRRNIIFKQEYLRALKLFDYQKMPQLRERNMARRWGSYTTDNKVSLNPKLIQAPREAIFYVCVHELCHVNNNKHDQKFYKEMDKLIPNWRIVKDHLEIRYG